MRNWEDIVKAMAAVGGYVIGIIGGWSEMYTVLAICMMLDVITGLIVAFERKSNKTENGGVSSKAGFAGLAKKSIVIVVILLAAMLDYAIGAQVFKMAATSYYIANEGISILENAAIVGVPFPAALLNALEVLRENNDKKSVD